MKYAEWKNIVKLIIGLIFKRQITIDGLNSGKTIENIVEQACKEKNVFLLKDVTKKLIISSVDLDDGTVYLSTSIPKSNNTKNISKTAIRSYSDKIEYIREIPICKAVRASCSFPGVFSPCKYKDHQLVDGGIRENVPWKELKANGADKVICIIFPKKVKEKKEKNMIDVIHSSIEMMGQELSNYELEGADYILKIETMNVGLLDTSKIDYFYQIGYKETKKKMKDIINSMNF
ncbi:MAG: patatin-like phospholipase family protein [Clostridia bacterium]